MLILGEDNDAMGNAGTTMVLLAKKRVTRARRMKFIWSDGWTGELQKGVAAAVGWKGIICRYD